MELKNAYPQGVVLHPSFKRLAFDGLNGQRHGNPYYRSGLLSGLTPVLNLITAEKPLYKESCLILGTLAVCKITGALTDVSVECLPITDPRLKLSWKNDLWRTRITFNPKKELALRII